MQNMSWSDMNNMFEQVTVKISGKNYILPFLTKGADGSRFNDFDESEWARNYSFIGAPGFYGCSAMSLKDMNYTLFKIAVHNHFNPGYEVKALGELFRSTNLNGTLTNYAFKGLEAVTSMGWTFAGNRFSPQYLTKNMMSCIPNLNAYDYMFGGN